MKIQSITSMASCRSDLCQRSNEARKTNFFTFGKTLTPAELKKYPLEKKLTYMFSGCGINDLVVVGKNFAEVYNGLKKTITNFNDVIKRILFVKHGGLSVPLAFGLNSDEMWSCINIGDKNVIVCTDDETDDVEPLSACTIDEGDVIVNNNVNIPIEMIADYSDYVNDNDDIALMLEPENFATKTYDMEEIQQPWISKANLAMLEKVENIHNKSTEKKKESKMTFDNIGGMDKTIETLKRSILYPIKFPFAYNNVELNKGVILYGKPGTGKTLLAETLAAESDAHFIKLCGTDLESKWIGETEASWRKTFADAKAQQPSIIFIDEFDAVVKERGRAANAQFSDKVVNQILALMSDLEKSDDKVFVIATTNKIDTIDSAIKRSGRFGKQIEVLPPDRDGLDAIFEIHTRNKNIDPNFDKQDFLDKCFSRQFTGADIKHITNEAHTNSWTRSGIYEKMESGTLTPADMTEVLISGEDFALALADWDKNQTSKIRKPIGYNK